MSTAPRTRGDAQTVARQTTESSPPPADGPRLFESDPPAERCAVPRDPEKVPDELAAKWDRNRGAEQRKEIRREYRRAQLREVDACLAVSAKRAAALFGLSERAWRRLDVTGQIPAPIKIGRMVRWRLSELANWVRARCPDRESWEAMRDV